MPVNDLKKELVHFYRAYFNPHYGSIFAGRPKVSIARIIQLKYKTFAPLLAPACRYRNRIAFIFLLNIYLTWWNTDDRAEKNGYTGV